jgi:hypothetical protein
MITAWDGASTENTRITNKILISKPVIRRKLIEGSKYRQTQLNCLRDANFYLFFDYMFRPL